mgnify:CR=1 FL=1
MRDQRSSALPCKFPMFRARPSTQFPSCAIANGLAATQVPAESKLQGIRNQPCSGTVSRLDHGGAQPMLALRLVALLFTLFAASGHALAGQVTLAWDAVAGAAGYKVYYGQSSGGYASNVDARNQLTYSVSGLSEGARYYFAVTAYGQPGTAESGFSNQVSTVVPTSTSPTASFTASLHRETPRLCRGGSRRLTYAGVHQGNSKS